MEALGRLVYCKTFYHLIQISSFKNLKVSEIKNKPLPSWLKKPSRGSSETHELKKLLRKSKLNTVCEEARCPNISECFQRGTATFMILGDICTRGCRFCSVITGKPLMPSTDFAAEGMRVAEAAISLGLKHVVVTSVARDDLKDGGASGFYETIKALRNNIKDITIEVLIPDFRGSTEALQIVVDAGPDVINHNLETVPSLYRKVRPGSSYIRSLELLQKVKELDKNITTKTGIMLGLGETESEVKELMNDAVGYKVEIFTAGQYMQPSLEHLPVFKYLPPEEFKSYKTYAESLSFKAVYIDPLVRSSYHAGEILSNSLAS